MIYPAGHTFPFQPVTSSFSARDGVYSLPPRKHSGFSSIESLVRIPETVPEARMLAELAERNAAARCSRANRCLQMFSLRLAKNSAHFHPLICNRTFGQQKR